MNKKSQSEKKIKNQLYLQEKNTLLNEILGKLDDSDMQDSQLHSSNNHSWHKSIHQTPNNMLSYPKTPSPSSLSQYSTKPVYSTILTTNSPTTSHTNFENAQKGFFDDRSDSLMKLMEKANRAVSNPVFKQKKLMKSKKQRDAEKKHMIEQMAFMTAVHIIEQAPNQEQEQSDERFNEKVIELLKKKTLQDDLQLLKRQIKEMNVHLRSYEKMVNNTEREIHSLAGRYNSYYNLKIPVKASSVDFSQYSVSNIHNLKNFIIKKT